MRAEDVLDRLDQRHHRSRGALRGPDQRVPHPQVISVEWDEPYVRPVHRLHQQVRCGQQPAARRDQVQRGGQVVEVRVDHHRRGGQPGRDLEPQAARRPGPGQQHPGHLGQPDPGRGGERAAGGHGEVGDGYREPGGGRQPGRERSAHEGRRGEALCQVRGCRTPAGRAQVHLHAGRVPGEAPGDPCGERPDERAISQPNRSLGRRGEPGGLRGERGRLVQQRLGVRQKDFALVGELHLAAGPLEQPQPQRALQARDGLAHRGLAHAQPGRRPGEAQMPGDQRETADLAERRAGVHAPVWPSRPAISSRNRSGHRG